MQCEHNLSTASVNRFVTTCLQTCNNLCVLTCVRSKRFQFCIEVHFMTPYNKNRYLYYFFSLTSLLSRVYCQQVFLDKFTFSCVLSTSFLWQVYFFVCTVNKFSLTSLLSRVYCQQVFLDKFTFSCVLSTSFPWQVYFLVCTVNKFSLTSLLSRVYCQQVFFDKFTFSCVQSTSFPWQVLLLVCMGMNVVKHIIYYVKAAFCLPNLGAK
jgi:hypothetical protein